MADKRAVKLFTRHRFPNIAGCGTSMNGERCQAIILVANYQFSVPIANGLLIGGFS
jgi:hypothetical protein